MKTKLLALLCIALFARNLQAQTDTTTLTVNCGENIAICPDDSYAFITSFALDADENLDTLFIGRNVKVAGGVEPYSYTWSCDTQAWYNGKFPINANDILNDVTSVNPYIIYQPYDNVTVFRLQVTDSKGVVAVDSLALLCSSFTYYTDGANDFSAKSDGNQIYLTGEQKNFESVFPMSYFAVINSDTIALPAYITIQETDSVTIWGIDSIGCHDYPRKELGKWLLVSIDETISDENTVKLIANALVFNSDSEKQICIYSVNGQLLYTKTTSDTVFNIPTLPNTTHCVCNLIVNNKSYSFHLLRP